MIDVMKMLSDPMLQMGLGIMGTPTGTGTVGAGIARGVQQGGNNALAMQTQLEALKAADAKRAYTKQQQASLAGWNPDLSPELKQAVQAGLITPIEALKQQQAADSAAAKAGEFTPVKQFEQERAGSYLASVGSLKGSAIFIDDAGTLDARGQVLAHKIAQLAQTDGDMAGATTQVLGELEAQGVLSVVDGKVQLDDGKFQDWIQGGGQTAPQGLTPGQAAAQYPGGYSVEGEEAPVQTGGQAPAVSAEPGGAQVYAAEDRGNVAKFTPVVSLLDSLTKSPYTPPGEDPAKVKKVMDYRKGVGKEPSKIMGLIKALTSGQPPIRPPKQRTPKQIQEVMDYRGGGAPAVTVGSPSGPLEALMARPGWNSTSPMVQATYGGVDPVSDVPDSQGPVAEGQDSAFDAVMKDAENSIRSGFDDQTGLWTPHKSLEGGADTIGYGHKLTKAEEVSGKVRVGDEEFSLKVGLTEEQVNTLYQQDKVKAEEKVRNTFGEYDYLPEKYKGVVLNIAFNTGNFSVKKWPKLVAAMRAGDDATVRQEMLTSATIGGKRQPLTKRRDMFADALLGQ